MAYIFRLHRNGTNINTDWSATNDRYGKNVIEHIKEPNENNTTRQITSIPSPFARIDLIKTAFKEVNNHERGVDGDTIYHKMVSDTLDVAEIFFNYDKLKNKFDILTWSISDLDNLKSKLHGDVKDTLQMFYNQDAATYHFDQNDEFYILRYKGSRARTGLDVVGATSPSTLFFTPANDFSYISEDINFGNDHPFDASYQPLHKRDFEFVKYLYLFRMNYNQNGSFANDFPEINDYLENCKNKFPIGSDPLNVINNLQIGDLANYQPLQIGNNTITILGSPWHKKTAPTNIQSDFEIVSDRYNGKKPLVLPCGSGSTYRNFQYVQAPWGDNSAPYSDNESDFTKRTLPHDGTPYPYLTIGDFLEDTLMVQKIKLNSEFTTNSKFIEDANGNTLTDKCVLLPLKPRFFDFFTIEDLQEGIVKLKVVQNEKIYKVTIEIPIKNNRTIKYEKDYTTEPNDKENVPEGEIKEIERQFSLAMMPMIRFENEEESLYKIAMIHKYKEDYKIEYYSTGGKLSNDDIVSVNRNGSDEDSNQLHVDSVKGKRIDYMRISNKNGDSGILIPEMKEQRTSKDISYEFAIDLGTTNTHIEYKKSGDNGSRAFDISESDIQLKYWESNVYDSNETDNSKESSAPIESDNNQMYISELIPQMIGTNSDFSFPIRTILLEAENCDYTQNKQEKVMLSNNVSFTHGCYKVEEFDRSIPDLKWSTDENAEDRYAAYVGNLMFLMRNKVILNRGRLSETKIKWFYPKSMIGQRRLMCEDIWRKTYGYYFGDNYNNISNMCEAEAPYHHNITFGGYQGLRTEMIANIDIGGGTTDVLFVKNDKKVAMTSFRFAANSIFENGYATDGNTQNGIIAYYTKEFFESACEKLKGKAQNIIGDLEHIQGKFNLTQGSDIASFYFSLKDNYRLKKEKIETNFDWNERLKRDDEFKVIFIFFYTAIIYHLAKIVKKEEELQSLSRIAFSGNGSKIISLISSDRKILAEYTTKIFKHVLGADSSIEISDIILEENPKVVTCKGGLSAGNAAENETSIDLVLKGDDIIKEESGCKYGELNKERECASVCNDIDDMIKFILKENDFISKNIAVDNRRLNLKKVLQCWELSSYKKMIERCFGEGLGRRCEELGNNYAEELVEETFFFYPIRGMLYQMSLDINNNIINK